MSKLRRLIKLMTCKHSRTIKYFPETVWWFRNGDERGKHSSVVITGCLDCGRVWVRDYGE
jgi:RNase P subunit RPR2